MGIIKVKLKSNNKKSLKNNKKLFNASKKKEDHELTNLVDKSSQNKVDNVGSDLESYLTNIGTINLSTENKIIEVSDQLFEKYHENESTNHKKKVRKVEHNTKTNPNKSKKKIIQNNMVSKDVIKHNDDYEAMSESELMKLKIENQVSIDITPYNSTITKIPRITNRWMDFGIPPQIYKNFQANLKFPKPTTVQALAYPLITKTTGFNLIAISPTGTGKTLAYVLPIIKKMFGSSEKGMISIIIAPTRELTRQVHNQFSEYLGDIDLISLVMTNPGEDIGVEISRIKRIMGGNNKNKKMVVISTPGRLIDLLTVNNGTLLDYNMIGDIVMDEFDRLLDLGFAPQIKNILNAVKGKQLCNKMMFSATMPNFLETFANKLLHEDGKTLVKFTVGGLNKCRENILQRVCIVTDKVEKYRALVDIINKYKKEPLVVFVKTQTTCDELGSDIDSKFYKDNNIYLLHAGRSVEERSQVVDEYKQNCVEFKKKTGNSIIFKRPILFCTQLLSRGLDIPNINIIVIYDSINSESQYVHTVGRTGRHENQNGVCITILNENEVECAQVLYRQIIKYPKEKSFKQMSENTKKIIENMNAEFWEGVKNGKFKNIDQGFSGKGLNNYESSTSLDSDDEENSLEDLSLSVSEVVFDNKKNKHVQSIYVDDIPQMIKRELLKASQLERIQSKTGSIINIVGIYKKDKGVEINVSNGDKLNLLETMTIINDFFNGLKKKMIKQQEQGFSI
ncbi:hypothetical protein ACO0R3_003765 [Hanseniaspora guilliermondii]